jgi:hypothetical protein
MKKIKWNWGTGILITIILFLIITISTTVFLMNQKVDLVSSDYYNKGIQHQNQIDMVNRTNSLDEKVSIKPEFGFIKLAFPKTILQSTYTGIINFYRPSDSNKDFSVSLSVDTSGQQLISTQNILKGYWKVIVNWTQDSVEYYKENSFVIN